VVKWPHAGNYYTVIITILTIWWLVSAGGSHPSAVSLASLAASAEQGKLSRKAREVAHPRGADRYRLRPLPG
jgi:hypothetical protein